MTRVSLLACAVYDSEILKDKILQGLHLIGFDPEAFRNLRVALKPNLMTVARPEDALITHPEFFRAVVRVVKDHGGVPLLAENPAYHSLERVVRKTGYLEVLREEAVEVADMKPVRPLAYAEAQTFKRIDISDVFFHADMIVNLPKLKTHALTHLTGAVKNLFGVIPGLEKSRMHMRVPTSRPFSDWLLDLYGALIHGFDPPKTILHLMDAVTGLEGEGPGSGGHPREIGALLLSRDAVALDYVAARITGLDVRKVHTITSGFLRPFSVRSPEQIEVTGDRVEDRTIHGFTPPKSSTGPEGLREYLIGTTFKNWFVERPVPDPLRCTLCYQCKALCPAGAIREAPEGAKVPSYDYAKCIRCFCCLEICPEAALARRRAKLQWLMGLWG
jgi:uncharacterized protein (DUF362 family)/Pyruvate/2-oxoacid:ferredoxin oxidoreductase delta subunit